VVVVGIVVGGTVVVGATVVVVGAVVVTGATVVVGAATGATVVVGARVVVTGVATSVAVAWAVLAAAGLLLTVNTACRTLILLFARRTRTLRRCLPLRRRLVSKATARRLRAVPARSSSGPRSLRNMRPVRRALST
jgi:hypothetical protein